MTKIDTLVTYVMSRRQTLSAAEVESLADSLANRGVTLREAMHFAMVCEAVGMAAAVAMIENEFDGG